MRFERGWLLLGLVFLLPLGWRLMRSEQRRREDLAALAHASILTALLPGRARTWTRVVALTGALGFLLLAAATPNRSALDDVPQVDRDLLLVVDASLSMGAEDVRPSRMQFAQETIRALLQRLNGERVGVIVFSGAAVMQCPLTRDYAAVSMLTRSLVPGALPQPGTVIGEALALAGTIYAKDRARARIALLITDGEDHDRPPQQIAAQLRRDGIHLFVLGVGTEPGAPIPVRDKDGRITGYKRDRAARLITTKLNLELLRGVASAAGGQLFTSETGSIEPLVSAITRVEEAGRRRRVNPVQTAFAVMALAGLFVELWAGHAVRTSRSATTV